MSLVLYYAPWSSATTCLWAVEELGIPCERVKLDLAAKATHTPEFLKLNPNGKVPVLVHDGVPIFESVAILAHLGETFGVEKKLFPAPGIERALAFQWLAWMNVSLGGAVFRFVSSSSDQVPADQRNTKAADLGKAETQRLLGILDAHLEGKTWMVGDSFTLVDVHLCGAMSWIGRLGFDVKALKNVAPWTARCQARPAFATVMGA
ncbi:MAG TPA: glutathione S-transferase family protein [Labilithrix sp.]|nr:glutathione S-transferase family protein [Labilithrix sp.]